MRLAALLAVLCGALLAFALAASAHTPGCQDGADNDGDTKVDHPADPGCDSPTDETESPDPAAGPGPENGEIAFARNEPDPNGDLGSDTDIYTMAPDGSGQTNRSNRAGADSQPAFSPDGKKIAFVAYDSSGRQQIYLMNADGSAQTRLTDTDSHNLDPAFSPDGRKIAFVSERASGREVFVMNTDGSGVTRLTVGGGVNPAFSPDGKKIAFSARRAGDKTSAIYVMNPDGSGLSRLSESPHDREPDFSPDGTKIAFTSGRDGNLEIYAMNADGTQPTRLTNNAAPDSGPAFSPDGKKIAFNRGRTTTEAGGIFTMNADGSGQTRITTSLPLGVGGSDGDPDWGPVPGSTPPPDPPDPQCSDGEDNDADGQTDHPADSDCASPSDNLEGPTPPQCSDSKDNDGDGKADHPADRGCSSADDDSESPDPKQCEDGKDNDGDGEADLADAGCEAGDDDSESPDPGERPYQAHIVEAPPSRPERWAERSAAAGDLNADGVGDLFVSGVSLTPDFPLVSFGGEVYAIDGKSRTVLYKIEAPAEDVEGFGFVISAVGDLSADGVSEVAVGTLQKRIYIFSGATGTLLRTLVSPNPQGAERTDGAATSDRFGQRIGRAGDLDGDGRSELIVGAPATDVPTGCSKSEPGCRPGLGRAYIFNGLTGVLMRTLDVPAEDQAATANGFGNAVQGPGDVDADGVPDQLVGGSNKMFLFSGKTGELIRKIDPPKPQAGVTFGFQDVAPLAPGDVNGDGHADLYGASYRQPGPSGDCEGRAWVFDGKTGAVLYEINDASPAGSGMFGWSMDRTDYDSDGTPDLYIGAAPHTCGPHDGGVAVYDGKDGSLLKAFELPDEDKHANEKGLGPALGWTVAAPGDLNGDGAPDFVAGAPFIDVGDKIDRGRLYFFVSEESSPKPQCSDAKDNDSDGKTDHPADPGCASAGDDSESPDPGAGPGPGPGGGPAPRGSGTPGASYPKPTPSAGGKTINGTAGNDTLNGTAGNDVINCGDGDDVVHGGPGNDVIRCGDGRDRTSGGAGNDRLFGEAGNDRLSGDSGNDSVSGGSGNDRGSGASGRDRLNGNSGDDILHGNSNNDSVSGSSGRDRISGNSGNDRLAGNAGNDRVSGDSGRDRINGGSGRDRLSGASGDDAISARDRRRDSVNCGRGRDRVSADRIDRVSRACERVRRRR